MKKNILTRIAYVLVKKYKPQKIILFGSHAWGKPDRDSDIDLLIVKHTKKSRVDRSVEVQRMLYGLHEGIPVEPLVLTPSELQRRSRMGDPFIAQILKAGRILYGK